MTRLGWTEVSSCGNDRKARVRHAYGTRRPEQISKHCTTAFCTRQDVHPRSPIRRRRQPGEDSTRVIKISPMPASNCQASGVAGPDIPRNEKGRRRTPSGRLLHRPRKHAIGAGAAGIALDPMLSIYYRNSCLSGRGRPASVVGLTRSRPVGHPRYQPYDRAKRASTIEELEEILPGLR